MEAEVRVMLPQAKVPQEPQEARSKQGFPH